MYTPADLVPRWGFEAGTKVLMDDVVAATKRGLRPREAFSANIVRAWSTWSSWIWCSDKHSWKSSWSSDLRHDFHHRWRWHSNLLQKVRDWSKGQKPSEAQFIRGEAAINGQRHIA